MKTWLLDEPQYLGQLFRFHRLQKALSLRQLETELGRSHAWLSQVEQGTIALTSESVERVFAALGLSPCMDFEHHQTFQKTFAAMLERLVFGDTQALHSFIEQWSKRHLSMLVSVDVVDYLLAMALTAPYDEAGLQPWSTIEILRGLEPLLAIMTPNQRFLWYLVEGRSELMRHHYNRSREALDQALTETVSPELQDLAAFYRVQALSRSYQLFEARKEYERLTENFERRGQIHRAMETKLISVMNAIRMHHLDVARTRLETVAHYVRQRGHRELFRPMIEIAMLLHLLLGEDERVLEYAKELKTQTPRTGFYQTFAAYRLKRPVTRFQITVEDEAHEPHAALFLRLTRLIDRPQNDQLDHEETFIWLSQAYEDFKTNDLIPEATLIYDTLKEILIRKRRYKEAYHMTDDMIEMVKKMMN